jgi:hypothetical protein
MSRLIGANKRFIDEHIPHLSALLVQDLDELLARSEAIVVGYQSPEFSSALQRLRSGQIVIDLARVARSTNMAAIYDGLCWQTPIACRHRTSHAVFRNALSREGSGSGLGYSGQRHHAGVTTPVQTVPRAGDEP